MTFLVLIFCLTFATVSSNKLNPGGEPFQLIGIFSNCKKSNNNLSTSSYYETADVCKKSIDWVIENKEFVANGTYLFYRTYKKAYFKHDKMRSTDNVEYLSYDVCTEEDGARVAVEILLNRKHFVKYTTKIPNWRNGYILFGERTSKVLAVVLYTEAKVTETIIYILQQSLFTIYQLDPNWKLPAFITKQTLRNRKVIEIRYLWSVYSRRIEFILKTKGISHFMIIVMNPPNKMHDPRPYTRMNG